MFFNFKKYFEGIYKKNKKLVMVFIYIITLALGDIVGASIYKYTSILELLQKESVKHAVKIDYFERKMVTQDAFTRDIVKRNSFNAYIQRKDTEYHNQMSFNTTVSSKIGFLEGKMNLFLSILDFPDFIENKKTESDDE